VQHIPRRALTESPTGLTYNAFASVPEQLLANAEGWPADSVDEEDAKKIID
jgi:hypothetical protein